MQFEFCAVPLDCKASAFIYLCLGLFVHLTGAACSLGVPVPRYNDDCHVGQLFHSPASASLVPGKVLAEAAAYIMCYLPTEAGYFIGTAKLQWVASMVVRFIGFLCDSSRQGILLPDDKRLKLSSLIEQILASRDVGLRKLQRFAREVFSQSGSPWMQASCPRDVESEILYWRSWKSGRIVSRGGPSQRG